MSETQSGEDSSPGSSGSSGSRKEPRRTDTGAVLNELERRNRAPGTRRRGSAGVVALFLLVILLASGGGWWSWQQWESMQSYQYELASYQDDLARVQSENQRLLQTLEETRESIGQDVETRLQRLIETEAELQHTVDSFDAVQQREEQRAARLQQQLGRDMQDVASVVTALQEQVLGLQQRDLGWLVAEADYLMRLAQRKLQLERDVDSSILLLRTVQDLLEGQMGMLAATAQQNILRDIEALRRVQLPDRAALAGQLNELSARLDELVFASAQQQAYQEAWQQWWTENDTGRGAPPRPLDLELADLEPADLELADSEPIDSELANSNPAWLDTLVDLLRTIFVWRELDDGQTAFLQPDQEQLLKQQMLLQLEQARLAVIQGDQGIFETTLQQLSRLLERYLEQDSQVTRELLATIESLRAMSVDVELPDLSTSANLVRQLAGSVIVREQRDELNETDGLDGLEVEGQEQ